MSLAAFKKKSIILYGSKRSGVPVYLYFLSQGPYGRPSTINWEMLHQTSTQKAVSGFSLNGALTDARAFKPSIGTPFRGIYPKGNGGSNGRYYSEPVFNMSLSRAKLEGNHAQYNKNSVVGTYGMLRQKYRYLYSGEYPNYWVQPNYGSSNLSDNTSQGLYVHNLSAANDKYVNTNDVETYRGHIVKCGSNGCQNTSARGYTMNVQMSNAPYTKYLHVPQTSSQHTLRMQRKCVRPLNYQKPYPGPTNGDSCNQIDSVNQPIFVGKEVFDNIDHIQNPEILLKQKCN